MHTFTLTLDPKQYLPVHLSEEDQIRAIVEMAKHTEGLRLDLDRRERTYHLGKEATPGRGYDDRLTTRLGLCRGTITRYLDLHREFGGKRGGLHSTWVGKYLVSEQDVRDWLAGAKPANKAKAAA